MRLRAQLPPPSAEPILAARDQEIAALRAQIAPRPLNLGERMLLGRKQQLEAEKPTSGISLLSVPRFNGFFGNGNGGN